MPHSYRVMYATEKVKSAVRDLEPEISVENHARKSKIVVLGNSGVGKTSIIYRHRYGAELGPCNPTIGASFVNCKMDVDGEPMQLQIWDTAGQERFRCMVPMYMRNAAAALIVYDITSRESFDDVEKWIQELNRCSLSNEPSLVLIGNKADLSDRRKVAKGEGVTKALMHNAAFHELSAFDPIVVDEMLLDLAKTIHDKRNVSYEEVPQPIHLDDDRENRTDRSLFQRCCSV